MPVDPWQQQAANMKQQQPQQDGSAPATATDLWSVGAGTAAPQSGLQTAATGATDFLKGIGEGAVHTLTSTDDWAAKHLPTWMTTPIGQAATRENQAKARANMRELERPTDTAQKAGKVVEQAAEFLVPGGAEEAAAEHLAPALAKIPRLARAAPTLAKIATSAMGAGAVNAAQGGSFKGGAAMGAAGSAVGAGLQKIAPVVAETALKMRAPDRAFGATPGRAILDDTSGFAPSKIVTSARDSLANLQDLQAGELQNADGMVSLAPTRNVVSKAADRVLQENHPGTIEKIGKLGEQLEHQYGTAQNIPASTMEDAAGNVTKTPMEKIPAEEIPEYVSPSRAAALNRGIANAKTSWNPATVNSTMSSTAGMMHHQLGESIAEVVPSIKPLNQRIQSLMPVVQRGTAADLNAGMMQRGLDRFKAHTGALAGLGIGGAYGYSHGGGVPGAILGGIAGVALPELMSSPETQMMAARSLNSPALRKIVIPAAQGAFLQSTHDE